VQRGTDSARRLDGDGDFFHGNRLDVGIGNCAGELLDSFLQRLQQHDQRIYSRFR
jgi:hypothetical protein